MLFNNNEFSTFVFLFLTFIIITIHIFINKIGWLQRRLLRCTKVPLGIVRWLYWIDFTAYGFEKYSKSTKLNYSQNTRFVTFVFRIRFLDRLYRLVNSFCTVMYCCLLGCMLTSHDVFYTESGTSWGDCGWWLSWRL